MNSELNAIVVLRCQAGDAQAFAELVRIWHGRLWTHARRLTGDPSAADDVLQETWSAVITGLPRLSDVDAFPKWVFRIATNKSRDWVRRRIRYRWVLSMLGRPQPQPQPQVPAPHGSLDAALAALSPLHIAPVTLHYFEGFSIEEIAQMLSIPSGTVKSRLSEARRRIREYLEATSNVQ